MIIFALQLYIEGWRRIVRGGNCQGRNLPPKGWISLSSRVHRNFPTNDRHPPFPPEEVVHDFHLLLLPPPLPSLFLFLERSHEEFQVRGEVGRMRLESGRPAYGLINHGMIGERRMSVKWKFVGVGLGINRGWYEVWGVKILIIIIFKKNNKRNVYKNKRKWIIIIISFVIFFLMFI